MSSNKKMFKVHLLHSTAFQLGTLYRFVNGDIQLDLKGENHYHTGESLSMGGMLYHNLVQDFLTRKDALSFFSKD